MHYKRRVIEAALGFLIGVGLLLAGVVIDVILIWVAGLMVMLACSMWAVTSYRRMTGFTSAGRTRPARVLLSPLSGQQAPGQGSGPGNPASGCYSFLRPPPCRRTEPLPPRHSFK